MGEPAASEDPGLPESTDVLIVGAGMAGLTAASVLCRTEHSVLVVEKSRDVGGRVATRVGAERLP